MSWTLKHNEQSSYQCIIDEAAERRNSTNLPRRRRKEEEEEEEVDRVGGVSREGVVVTPFHFGTYDLGGDLLTTELESIVAFDMIFGIFYTRREIFDARENEIS